MDIISIVVIRNGILDDIQNFPIFEDQLSEDVKEKADEIYLELLEKYDCRELPTLFTKEATNDNGIDIFYTYSTAQ